MRLMYGVPHRPFLVPPLSEKSLKTIDHIISDLFSLAYLILLTYESQPGDRLIFVYFISISLDFETRQVPLPASQRAQYYGGWDSCSMWWQNYRTLPLNFEKHSDWLCAPSPRSWWCDRTDCMWPSLCRMSLLLPWVVEGEKGLFV